MKKNMKLMSIYEIQKLHHVHKSKLSTIKAVNNRLKTYQSVCSNVEKINNYKRNKIHSQCFLQRQRINKIQQQNRTLHSRMYQMSQRCNNIKKQRHRKDSTEVRSVPQRKNLSVNIKLNQQNAKYKQRLINTKSSFQSICFDSRYQKGSRKFSHQQQVVHLLEKHLKIKPSVVFPVLNSSAIKRAEIKSRKNKCKQSRIDQNKTYSIGKTVPNAHKSVDCIQTEPQQR